MKILHCCLANFYIDNYGYQENILTKMHKLQGHEVEILASTETFVNNKLGYVEPRRYENEHGIVVTRIPYIQWLPHSLIKKLRIYSGLRHILEEFQPDIIFLHDVQFLSIKEIVRYINRNPNVKLYADGHTDFINSARNWLSKNILHKVIYKYCAKSIEPYIQKFWGVTPLRVDFFRDVYKIEKNKVDLLVMGVDDSVVDFTKKEHIRKKIRKKLNIAQDDFIIVTGGKLDRRKNIHILMKAINSINIEKIKLIVFGVADKELKNNINELVKSEKIKYIGWISPDEVYNYYFASDLAFFPGTHSVLWEQAVGVGLPSVFKKWEGIQHVNVGGNCIFLEEGNESEIKETIEELFNNKIKYNNMKNIALTKGKLEFSYSEIAKKAIGLNN